MFVTLTYDGKGQPSHLAGGISMKGHHFASGKEVEVHPLVAGQLLLAAPEGTVKVSKGEPQVVSSLPASSKQAVAAAYAHSQRFPIDPASVLSGLKPLPAVLVKALGESNAVATIDKGDADKHLGAVAVWAQIGGKAEVAKAAARRAEFIKPKA